MERLVPKMTCYVLSNPTHSLSE